MTITFLNPKAAAAYLGLGLDFINGRRRAGAFPGPDVRIRSRYGWSKFRLDRYAVQTWGWEEPEGHAERVRAATRAGVPDGNHKSDGAPLWWLTEPTRYLGLPDLAQAAGLHPSALWTHYYKGGLGEPDIAIGERNRIAGWSTVTAAVIAARDGWSFDLARLDDTAGLGDAL